MIPRYVSMYRSEPETNKPSGEHLDPALGRYNVEPATDILLPSYSRGVTSKSPNLEPEAPYDLKQRLEFNDRLKNMPKSTLYTAPTSENARMIDNPERNAMGRNETTLQDNSNPEVHMDYLTSKEQREPLPPSNVSDPSQNMGSKQYETEQYLPTDHANIMSGDGNEIIAQNESNRPMLDERHSDIPKDISVPSKMDTGASTNDYPVQNANKVNTETMTDTFGNYPKPKIIDKQDMLGPLWDTRTLHQQNVYRSAGQSVRRDLGGYMGTHHAEESNKSDKPTLNFTRSTVKPFITTSYREAFQDFSKFTNRNRISGQNVAQSKQGAPETECQTESRGTDSFMQRPSYIQNIITNNPSFGHPSYMRNIPRRNPILGTLEDPDRFKKQAQAESEPNKSFTPLDYLRDFRFKKNPSDDQVFDINKQGLISAGVNHETSPEEAKQQANDSLINDNAIASKGIGRRVAQAPPNTMMLDDKNFEKEYSGRNLDTSQLVQDQGSQIQYPNNDDEQASPYTPSFLEKPLPNEKLLENKQPNNLSSPTNLSDQEPLKSKGNETNPNFIREFRPSRVNDYSSAQMDQKYPTEAQAKFSPRTDFHKDQSYEGIDSNQYNRVSINDPSYNQPLPTKDIQVGKHSSNVNESLNDSNKMMNQRFEQGSDTRRLTDANLKSEFLSSMNERQPTQRIEYSNASADRDYGGISQAKQIPLEVMADMSKPSNTNDKHASQYTPSYFPQVPPDALNRDKDVNSIDMNTQTMNQSNNQGMDPMNESFRYSDYLDSSKIAQSNQPNNYIDEGRAGQYSNDQRDYATKSAMRTTFPKESKANNTTKRVHYAGDASSEYKMPSTQFNAPLEDLGGDKYFASSEREIGKVPNTAFSSRYDRGLDSNLKTDNGNRYLSSANEANSYRDQGYSNTQMIGQNFSNDRQGQNLGDPNTSASQTPYDIRMNDMAGLRGTGDHYSTQYNPSYMPSQNRSHETRGETPQYSSTFAPTMPKPSIDDGQLGKSAASNFSQTQTVPGSNYVPSTHQSMFPSRSNIGRQLNRGPPF